MMTDPNMVFSTALVEDWWREAAGSSRKPEPCFVIRLGVGGDCTPCPTGRRTGGRRRPSGSDGAAPARAPERVRRGSLRTMR